MLHDIQNNLNIIVSPSKKLSFFNDSIKFLAVNAEL